MSIYSHLVGDVFVPNEAAGQWVRAMGTQPGGVRKFDQVRVKYEPGQGESPFVAVAYEIIFLDRKAVSGDAEVPLPDARSRLIL